MREVLIGVIVLILVAGAGILYFYPTLYGIVPQNDNIPKLADLPTSQLQSSESAKPDDIPAETIIAEGLDTPWGIAFLPNGDMLITERKGTVRLFTNGQLQEAPVATISSAREIGEGGLLGIALHPDFANNNYVYLYYTYAGVGDNTSNRVVRMKYANGQLTNEEIILDKIPGASNHNGGRIKFGPDKFLYITTGDAQEPSLAQEVMSDAGKILRVNDNGEGAPGNLNNSQVYSYGHRNPQGIAWDSKGNLWETEHGPSGGSLGTGNDEVNFIEAGNNYGWPEIQGDQTRSGMVTPVINSTPQISWAPGGTAIINDILYFSGLRGQALYKTRINGSQLSDFQELFKGKYGRVREVMVGPDGMLYITTSNRDGRGVPKNEDDRIIRVNPSKI